MIEVKLLEIRDAATTIPALAIRVRGGAEEPILHRAGFGTDAQVLLIQLEGMKVEYDPYSWKGARTMPQAHEFIRTNWNDIVPYDVIDVEFILRETSSRKTPEIGDWGLG